MTEKDPEINEKPNTIYDISVEAKTDIGIEGYHPINNRLQIPSISKLAVRAAPNRVARNVLVGDMLEDPVEFILSKISGLIYYRNPRFQLGHSPQAIPDFNVGFNGQTTCIECKNWICGYTLDERNINRLILPQFRRFEAAYGIKPRMNGRISVLAGPVLVPEIEEYLHAHGITVVTLPAIQPRGPSLEQLRFLNWSLRLILHGSRRSPFIMTS